MAARVATFVVKRGDIAKLAAAGASGSAFKQTLAECMVEPGDGFGLNGYTPVFLLHYLEGRGIYVGSEYPAAEQALNLVAAVGANILTPRAFSSIAELDPQLHDEKEISEAVAELGVTVPDAGADGITWLEVLWHKLRALNDHQALLILVG